MQHRRDELAEARPEALLGTRRRFLTLAGAAAVLAFSTRLPGTEKRPSALARGLPVRARRGVRRSAAGRGRALDAARARAARAGRRDAARAGRRALGGRARRRVHADRADAARPSARPSSPTASTSRSRAWSRAASTSTASSRAASAARRPHAHRARPGRPPRCGSPSSPARTGTHGFFTAYQHMAEEDARPRRAPRRLHLRVRHRPGRRPAQQPIRPRRRWRAETPGHYRTATRTTRPTRTCRPRTPLPVVVTWDDHEVDNNYAGATSRDRRRRGGVPGRGARTPTRPTTSTCRCARALPRARTCGSTAGSASATWPSSTCSTRASTAAPQPSGDERFDAALARSSVPSRRRGC